MSLNIKPPDKPPDGRKNTTNTPTEAKSSQWPIGMSPRDAIPNKIVKILSPKGKNPSSCWL